ncbi:hypothetical protein VTN31DRAFT_5505 [Thermomyces dupontii]|uniref:uncharacterized protein n=1 Tax=Talaromyces thermophilus TaxID=28565 RepID=UPI003743792A
MPRERQKRGRRAQEKEKKKNQAKRKLEDTTEEPAAKRSKPTTDDGAPEYIPLEDSGVQGNGQGNDTPFYGLLDEEEQQYLSGADEVLELNQFRDEEERRIFVQNVYEEIKGKELKIACSQSCSRLMEKLIMLSDTRQVRRLFSRFLGHFLHLVQHRFASHCCETLFIRAAPAVTTKVSKAKKAAAANAQEEEEPNLTLAEMFLHVVKELDGNWGYLLTERFASHTIRVLLLVLAGEPVDVSSTNSVVASKKNERLVVPGLQSLDETGISRKRQVPEEFVDTLKKIMHDMTAGLDDTSLKALATHPLGNPVLQVLLSIELGAFGKSTAKDPRSIFRRLIPDDQLEEGSPSAVFLSGLLYDPVGSRLVEAIVQLAPGKLFKSIHKNIIRPRISSLCRNEIAGYVLIRVLGRVGRDDLQDDMQMILPEMASLIERSRLVIPRTLIERCLARNVDTHDLAKAIEASYDQNPAIRLRQILRIGEPGAESNSGTPSPEKTHGSLLAQTMLDAPGPVSELIYSGLLDTAIDGIISIACDPTTSHVLQKALTAQTSTPQFRRQLVPRFYGHIKDLAMDSSGSHVVDSLWHATADIFFVKERLAQELAHHELALRDTFVGRAVWKNWCMDLYKRRRGEWKMKAKNLEVEGDGEQEQRPKTKVDIARERFVQRQEKAKLVQGVRS